MMKVSHYRSPEFELIHSFDLSLVKLFTEYLSGTKKFINGGAVLAATSMGNRPATYTMDAALQQALEKSQGVAEITQPNPWKEWDARVAAALEKAKIMDLKGLSRAEARGLMEYWASSGVLRQTVTEQVVAEKWTVAGHGVVGEIKRNVLEKHIAV
jgi:small subunit ribosomal protein S29